MSRHRLATGAARPALLPWTLLGVLLLSLAGPARAEPSLTYTTRPGDTLIGLGQRLLAEPPQWNELARFNAIRNPQRLPVGTVLQIPLRLLKSEPLEGRVEQVVGPVHSGAVLLRGGEALAEGAVLRTAADGSALLRLADGSVLRLAAGSAVQIERARRYPTMDHLESGVRLEAGRVEVKAARAPAGKPGFVVRTPQGLLSVRGTEFRASTGGADLPATRGEVLEGAVQFDGTGAGRPLGAGFGTVIDDAGRVAEPTPLLPAPDVSAMPRLQERLVLRFPLVRQGGALRWRGQVARDAQMREVLADNVTDGAELRFTHLDDGDYHLQLRAIDARGLEGANAMLAFKLKARPEPPMPQGPAPRAVTRGTQVELTWASNAEAKAYRLQVAADERFARLLHDLPALDATSHTLQGLAPGDYFWRLASVRAGDDRGPWGATRAFVMRAPPATPAPPAVGEQSLSFAWEGEPGQTFDFMLARDAAFTDIVLQRQLSLPTLELPRPPGGIYYMRLRARDADGYQGPYTTPQRFEIIDCVKAGDGSCVQTPAAGPLRRP